MGIILFATLFFWLRWLYRPNPNASRVDLDFTKSAMLFGVPFVLYSVGMGLLTEFFEEAGVGVLFERHEDLMLFGVGLPLVLIGAGLALAYFLQLLGIPLPRFMYPRWVWEIQQEQREFEREQRRIKRERRKLKRELRRLKKADQSQ